MRKLSIKREKSFVGCAAKMQVYISDFQSNELEMPLHTVDTETGEKKVKKISCRKLGEIKNGEEATFEIGNDAAMIFVIADKASKDFCNDCYPIKAGDEDISLSGKNKFNPMVGNAFRINDNDVNMTANRKKSTGKGVFVIIAAAIVGVLVGYFGMAGVMSGLESREKVFTAGPMSITLNEGFEQEYPLGYAAVYSYKDVAVFITTTEGMETDEHSALTEEQYAKLVINSSKISDAKLTSDGNLTYFVYDSGEAYTHHTYVYKNGEDFWLFDFVTETKSAKKYSDDILKWAGSVKFN